MMDILEELRKQSKTEQKAWENSKNRLDEINTYQYSVRLGALKKIHDYLYELSSKLNQLDYTTTVEIHIPEIGAISNLCQNNYELLWGNRANQNQVTLNFSTQIKDTCPLSLDEESRDKLKTILKQSNINFSTDQNNIMLKGVIHSSISFSINPDNPDILLSLNNFKKLGKQRYSLTEKLIDDTFFEQLGQFILHRKDNFIKMISSTAAEQTTPSNESLYEQESGFLTQEMDISKIRSLFNKEVQLYLTYHDAIKDINPKSDDFIIGRSRQCHIIIQSDLASRQHARIVYRKGKYVLIDQSTNGTFVKTQGGKEVYVQGEAVPLSGSGFISLGKSATVDNEHVIYFSCQ